MKSGGKWRLNCFACEALAVIGLILLVTLRFFPTLAEGRFYAPFRDNVNVYGPLFSETARLALQGIFPYYLPSLGTGFPLFENPHYSVCYPFYFFGLLDYGGPLQSLYTLTHLAIFHRFLFALSLYGMLRCARISPWAAFTSASIGVFARNTELYASWITMTASYTWMPLFIGGAILLLRFPGRFWNILLLGVSAGMIALASPSQSVVHALFFSVIFFGAGLIWTFRNRGVGSALRLIKSLAAAMVIAFGLAAVAAIPVYLGLQEMIRFIGGGFVLGGTNSGFAYVNYHLPLVNLDSMVNPVPDLEINCLAQLSILETCRSCNPQIKIIFASTRQIYGRPTFLPVTEAHPLNPVDINGINKMAAEKYHLLYSDVYGMHATAIRLTNTIGPRMRIKDARQTFVGVWIRQVLEGKPIQVWGGKQLRDFTDIEDAVDAFLLVAASPETKGQVYNLGGSEVIALTDLAKQLVEVNGGGEYSVCDFPADRRAIDIGDYYGDFSKIRVGLGWSPRKPLRETLKSTLDYYREFLPQYL